jgi:5'-AMP-activated protein kinase regulatory gamma subunit
MLRKPLKDLNIGVYSNLATATMDTPVIDVIHLLASKGVSSIPILDSDGVLQNIYESIDVLTLIKGGIYNDLKLTVGEALMRRSEV